MPFSEEFIYNANADYKLKYNKLLLKYFSIYVNQEDFFIANYYPITLNNESEFNNWKSK